MIPHKMNIRLIEIVGSNADIEQYLRKEISKNMEIEYPSNPDLESKLVNHIDGIVYDQNDNNLNV